MDKEPVIEVKEVRKHFGKIKAVNGIDLKIWPGEFLALLGPNGAGKTTLVEMIEGIQRPDSGTISIRGMNWKKHQAKLRAMLGLSLQETHFIDKLTVRETLKLFASFYSLEAGRIEEILKLVNLEEKQKSYTKNLSGGQRQRLALGIAFLNRPEILLLDEPTTGLDPAARREIWDILFELREKFNTTMILTTHYMEEADYLCDRIVIIDQGKILAQGTLEELLAAHESNEIIQFRLGERTEKFELPRNGHEHKLHWDEKEQEWQLSVHDIVQYLPDFLATIKEQGLTLSTLECRKMTLDDLFIKMTGRRLDE
ncbi:MAG: ABC transporter ATP-binding protein [Bacteroidia bacterium]